jgi:hypothetical protein
MSAIDPTQGSRTAIAPPTDGPQLDAASLLMMLSWKQLDALHGSLLAGVSVATTDFSSLGRIGELNADLGKLRSTVLAKELDNAERLLPQDRMLRERVNNAGIDPVVLSDADQQDMLRLEQWAKERGFVGPSLMTEQPVPKSKNVPDVLDATGTGDGPPETETVLNQEAYLEFRDALQGYISELKAGTADNPALRSQYQSAPEYERLAAALKSLGISTTPDSPLNIEQTLQGLGQLTNQIITRLEEQAAKMQKLIGEVDNSSKSLGELSETERRIQNAADDRKVDAQVDQILSELDATQRARLEQVLETLKEAQVALERSNVVPDKVDWPQVDTRFGDELHSQFSKWEVSLQELLEPPPSPPQAENRSIRSGKQFV